MKNAAAICPPSPLPHHRPRRIKVAGLVGVALHPTAIDVPFLPAELIKRKGCRRRDRVRDDAGVAHHDDVVDLLFLSIEDRRFAVARPVEGHLDASFPTLVIVSVWSMTFALMVEYILHSSLYKRRRGVAPPFCLSYPSLRPRTERRP